MKYITKDVCSRSIEFEVIEGKVKNIRFEGGCAGNAKGIAILIEGMDIDQVIAKLEYIKCKTKETSCPDQLAKALKQYKENK